MTGRTKQASRTRENQKSSLEPAQIQQLRAQVHSDDVMIAAKTKEQEQIKKQIGLYQARVQSSPAVEQQYKELTRGYQTALDSYNESAEKSGTTRSNGDEPGTQTGRRAI